MSAYRAEFLEKMRQKTRAIAVQPGIEGAFIDAESSAFCPR